MYICYFDESEIPGPVPLFGILMDMLRNIALAIIACTVTGLALVTVYCAKPIIAQLERQTIALERQASATEKMVNLLQEEYDTAQRLGQRIQPIPSQHPLPESSPKK